MKRGKIKPTDTDRQTYALHHTSISTVILGKHIATIDTTHTLSSTALLGPISSREELLHTCDTRLQSHLIRCPCVSLLCFSVLIFYFYLFLVLVFFLLCLTLCFSFSPSHYDLLYPLAPSSRNSLKQSLNPGPEIEIDSRQ